MEFQKVGAPALTEKELVAIKKWVDDLYQTPSFEGYLDAEKRQNAEYLRRNKFPGMFGHPDNIRYLGDLFGLDPPDWFIAKYREYLKSEEPREVVEEEVEEELEEDIKSP